MFFAFISQLSCFVAWFLFLLFAVSVLARLTAGMVLVHAMDMAQPAQVLS